MKNLFFLFILLIGVKGFSQAQLKWVRWGKLTTTEINNIDVSDTSVVYTAYNTTLGYEVINVGSGWVRRITQTGLVESDIDTFAELDAIVADQTLLKSGDNVSTLTNDSGYITSETDDQTASEVTVGHTPSNYSVSGSSVEDHIQGIDAAIVGGGGTADGNDFVTSVSIDGSDLMTFNVSNQTNPTVDLSPYKDGIAAQNQTITTNKTIELQSGSILSIQDDDNNVWFRAYDTGAKPLFENGVRVRVTPTIDNEAASKRYVDDAISGVSGGSGTNYQGVSSPVQMTSNHNGTTSNQVDDSGELKWIHHYVSSNDDFSVTLDNQHPLGETFTYSVLSDGSQITIKPSSGSVNVKIKGTNEGSTNNQLVASTHGDLIHFTRYANNQYIVWGDGTASDADFTAPTVVSATVEDADPDSLVVVFSEAVNVTNLTDLSLNGSWTGVGFSSIVSGSGTTTVTFDLDTDIAGGESGSFVYGASNTISDLAGNSLASSSTSVTNNVTTCTPLATTYYDEADAASDFYCNEANAVSSYWTTNNASIAAVQVGSEEGIYALEFTQSGAGAAYVEYNIPGTETNGQVFDVELRLQEVTSINGVLSQWQNVSGDTPTSVTLSTTITTYSYSPTATGNLVRIRIYINGTGGSAGDKVRLYWMKLTAG